MRFDVFFSQNKTKVLSEFHIFSSSDDKGDEEEMKKWLATKSPEYAYSSAYIGRDTYKKYKDLFEAKILESPYWTVKYVTDVLNGIREVTHKPHNRWPKGESVIAKDPYASWLYARYIIYGRWPEGEKAIFDSEDPQYKDIYLDFLNNIGYQDEDNQELSFESFFTEAKKKVTFTSVNFPNGIDFGKYNFGRGGRDFEQLNDINDLQSTLHPTTYERLIQIKNAYDAEWTGLIKFKNANTKKTSFIIFGKVNKDVKGNKLSSPEEVAYYRKETSAHGIGTTSIYFKDRVYPVNNFLEFTNLDTPKKIVDYAKKVTKGRVPKNLEDIIATDARASFNYAKVIKERFPAGEKQILDNLYWVDEYANEVIKGRWPEAEPLVATDAGSAVTYAKNVLKKRWTDVPDIPKDKAKEIEDRIRDYEFVFQPFSYARDVIQGRWEDFEHRIVNDPFQAYEYAVFVLKDRWPAGEPAIFSEEYTKNAYLDFLKKQGYEDEDNEEQDDVINLPTFEDDEGFLNIDRSVDYAIHQGKRWPQLERDIIVTSHLIPGLRYVRYVIKGRWIEFENYLKKHNYINTPYGETYFQTLRDLGYEDEDNQELSFESFFNESKDDIITAPLIRDKDGHVDLEKCMDIARFQGKRWPKLEEEILNYYYFFAGIEYARAVIKGRWYELEELLKDYEPGSSYIKDYTLMLRNMGYEDEDNEEQDDVINDDLITARYRSGKEVVQLDDCLDYAAKIGKRWPKLEQYILYLNFPHYGVEYAKRVIKGRWIELENYLKKYYGEDSHYVDEYLRVLKDLGYEDEDNEEITQESISSLTASEAYALAKTRHREDPSIKRFSELEKIIITNSYYSTLYAGDVLGERWPEAEPLIAKNAYAAYVYVVHVIKGRWPQGEPAIFDSEYKDDYLKFLQYLGYEDEDNEEQNDVITRPLFRFNKTVKKTGNVDIHKCIFYASEQNKKWPELEKLLLDNEYFSSAILYAERVIKGRWLELENTLDNASPTAGHYFRKDYIKMLKKLNYEDEDNEEQNVITRPLIYDGIGDVDIEACLVHAERRNKRWPELEKIILNSKELPSAILYAERVLKGRWLELENILNNASFADLFYKEQYVKMLKEIGYQDEDNEELSFESFFTEAKSKVRPPTQDELTDPLSAAIYASQVLGGRWKEKEDLIASKAMSAFQYANEVLKDRWINIPDISKNIAEFAEGAIRKSSIYSVPYAEHIIKDRWPELEKDILDFGKNVTAVYYAINVLKRRWPEAEPFIMRYNDTKEDYINFLNDIGYQDEDNEEFNENEINKNLFLTPGVNGVMVVDDYRCLQYAVEQGKRWPEFEKHIIESRKLAVGVQYAKDVLKGRWPALEVLLKPLPYLQHVYIGNLNKIGYEDEDNQELSFESFFSENTKIPSTSEEVYVMAKELGERVPEYEHIILNDKSPKAPYWAYEYLKKIINKDVQVDYDKVTWPEAEPVLARDGDIAYRYALYYINAKYWDDEEYNYTPLTRFPLGEPQIAKDTDSAGKYARHVLKSRWPEGEEAIFKDNFEKKKYIEFLNDSGYQDEDNEELSFESFFIEAKSEVTQPSRPPTQKELTNPHRAYMYARKILKRRWFEMEPLIAKDVHVAYQYAKFVVKGEFPEGEPTIAKNGWTSSLYARLVTKRRFPLGEPAIAKDGLAALEYAINIIKDRWPEGEEAIFKNEFHKKKYLLFLTYIGYQDEDNEEL